jgi:RuvB-like protein 1 (pontin 52)
LTEGIELQEEALSELGMIGARTSLRYCEQLLVPARILAESYGRKAIQYPFYDLCL